MKLRNIKIYHKSFNFTFKKTGFFDINIGNKFMNGIS